MMVRQYLALGKDVLFQKNEPIMRHAQEFGNLHVVVIHEQGFTMSSARTASVGWMTISQRPCLDLTMAHMEIESLHLFSSTDG